MSTDLGSLIYTLRLDDVGFEGQVAANEAQMAGMAAKAEESSVASGASFNKVAMAAAVVGVGIGIVADKTVKAAGDYQQQLTQLVTGAGENAANIDMVGQHLLSMSTATGESTKQLTDGMFMIESAGYHGKAGLDVLQAAAEGAKVGNADLGTVADATTTIMKDFGGTLPTQAVNALIATVANGKTHMQDLGQSLAMILPTASAAHVGLKDVMGAMATMTGEGVPAANAATYLRQTIIGLEAPSPKAVKALKDIGLSSVDVATEMQTSLPGALKMITDHLGKVYKEGSPQYVAALKDISGGSKTMQGMLDLTGQHMADFGKNVDAVAGQVKEGGNKVIGWAEVQKDFNFKVDQLKASAGAAGIAIGQNLLPAIGAIAGALGAILQPIASFIANNGKVATTIIEVVAAAAAMVLGIFAVSKAIEFVGAVMDMVAATNPVLLAIMAIALAAVVIINYWTPVKKFFEGIWKSIEPYVMPIVQFFQKNILPVLKEVANFLVGQLKAAWKDISHAFGEFMQAIKPIEPVLKIIGIALLVALVAPMLIAVATIALVIGAIVAIGVFLARLIGWIANVEGAIVLWVEGFIGGIGQFFGAIASTGAKIVDWFNKLPGVLLGMLAAAGSWLYGIGRDIIQGMVNGIVNMATSLWNGVANVSSNIGKFFNGAGSWLFDVGKNIIQGLINGVGNMASLATNAVKNVGKSIVDGVKSFLGIHSPSTMFDEEVGQQITAGVAQGITKGAKGAVTATLDMTHQVVAAGKGSLNNVQNPLAAMANNQSTSTVQYNFGQGSVVLSSAGAVREFFNIGNRNTQLEAGGISPLAGTAGV